MHYYLNNPQNLSPLPPFCQAWQIVVGYGAVSRPLGGVAADPPCHHAPEHFDQTAIGVLKLIHRCVV